MNIAPDILTLFVKLQHKRRLGVRPRIAIAHAKRRKDGSGLWHTRDEIKRQRGRGRLTNEERESWGAQVEKRG